MEPHPAMLEPTDNLDRFLLGLRSIPTVSEMRQAAAARRRTEEVVERSRAIAIFRKYGLSESAFAMLYIQQDGLCAICSTPLIVPNVDHCHKTGRVRGLLCRDCNTGLGNFRDDPRSLRRAMRYLKRSDLQTF